MRLAILRHVCAGCYRQHRHMPRVRVSCIRGSMSGAHWLARSTPLVERNMCLFPWLAGPGPGKQTCNNLVVDSQPLSTGPRRLRPSSGWAGCRAMRAARTVDLVADSNIAQPAVPSFRQSEFAMIIVDEPLFWKSSRRRSPRQPSVANTSRETAHRHSRGLPATFGWVPSDGRGSG